MSRKLHWLVYILLKEKIISHEVCINLLEVFGDEINAEDFAQEAYNIISSDFDDKKAVELLDKFEKALESADDKAGKGEEVPDFNEIENDEQKAVTDEFDENPDFNKELAELLENMLETSLASGASDLHITPNVPPFIRKNLKLEFIADMSVSEKDAYSINTVFLNEAQKSGFEKNKKLVFSLQLKNSRYRVTLIKYKNGVAGIYHLLPNIVRNFKNLGFKEEMIQPIEKLTQVYNGLILITGPKNSGKTSTISGFIDLINKRRKENLVYIENTIEIVIDSEKCNISQREIGTHVKSYSDAINNAISDDTDIIVLDDIKDIKTVKLALEAVEKGHLVIAGITAYDTVNALTRIVSFFPEELHKKIKSRIAENLRGVLCQKLVRDINNKMVVAIELLINTISVSSNIAEGKFYLLRPAMQVDKKYGMCIMDDYIYELFREGTITDKVAMSNIVNKKQYEKMISSSNL